MFKYIAVLIVGILTSFYFFPFVSSLLPMANTKMVMALFGLIVLGLKLTRDKRAEIEKDILVLSLYAIGVSFMGLTSVILNDSKDYTYASYIMSMWVWLGGAYFVINCIKWVHGRVSVKLVSHYLIGVCVAQCLLAYTMEQYAPLKNIVDSLVISEGFMGKVEGRMYGLGAALDVAGMRFAAILVIIGYLCVGFKEKVAPRLQWIYIIAFCLITLIGNMIGRTTTVGAAMALLFIFCVSIFNKNDNVKSFWGKLGITLLMFIPIVIYLYKTNHIVQENFRFAFEGFYNLFEKGEWQTTSNDRLMNMYVWPDNLKTWMIGDGYFKSPLFTNPYYIGPGVGSAFYMHTDVGYCRFLFYFGSLGLILFMLYFGKVAAICVARFSKYKQLFLLLLLFNFIVWLKVSSDLFVLFALFLCVSKDENEEYERNENERNILLSVNRTDF